MATQSRILALRIPWTEEAGGLQCDSLDHKECDTMDQLTHIYVSVCVCVCVCVCVYIYMYTIYDLLT